MNRQDQERLQRQAQAANRRLQQGADAQLAAPGINMAGVPRRVNRMPNPLATNAVGVQRQNHLNDRLLAPQRPHRNVVGIPMMGRGVDAKALGIPGGGHFINVPLRKPGQVVQHGSRIGLAAPLPQGIEQQKIADKKRQNYRQSRKERYWNAKQKMADAAAFNVIQPMNPLVVNQMHGGFGGHIQGVQPRFGGRMPLAQAIMLGRDGALNHAVREEQALQLARDNEIRNQGQRAVNRGKRLGNRAVAQGIRFAPGDRRFKRQQDRLNMAEQQQKMDIAKQEMDIAKQEHEDKRAAASAGFGPKEQRIDRMFEQAFQASAGDPELTQNIMTRWGAWLDTVYSPAGTTPPAAALAPPNPVGYGTVLAPDAVPDPVGYGTVLAPDAVPEQPGQFESLMGSLITDDQVTEAQLAEQREKLEQGINLGDSIANNNQIDEQLQFLADLEDPGQAESLGYTPQTINRLIQRYSEQVGVSGEISTYGDWRSMSMAQRNTYKNLAIAAKAVNHPDAERMLSDIDRWTATKLGMPVENEDGQLAQPSSYWTMPSVFGTYQK